MNGKITPMAKTVANKDNRWESLYRASQELGASLNLGGIIRRYSQRG